jgi:hypothetical protein
MKVMSSNFQILKEYNFYTLEESFFESVSVFKGDFGTTFIYKSTAFSFKNCTTGNL